MDYLFKPIEIRKMGLKNRIVMPSIGCFFVGEQLKNFYIERADGNVGLIVIGPTAIDEDNPSYINVYNDEFIPELRDLAESIKAHGSRVGLQLWHPGRYSSFPGDHVVSASDIPAPIFTRQRPRALTIPEIENLEDEFADGALRTKKAGFDCVEFTAATGYLISQFLSSATNKRTDKYGGSLENRARFLLNIIDKTRDKVGEDFPILCRISGNEYVEGGNTLEDQKSIAIMLEKAGVDALNVNVGWHESPIDQMSMMVPRGGFIYLAAKIKEVVNIPVIASHRINDPVLANDIIKEGKADMVAMARPLIADPELPKKAKEGRFNEIRTCIACNSCFDMVFEGLPITCLVNPAVGRESEFKITPVDTPKKVIIVGGGPGGMEAARVTHLRGHNVSLYEKDRRLGGQINLITACPDMEEFANVPRYYNNQLKDVDIVYNVDIKPDFLIDQKPDAIIVATGASPIIPNVPGVDNKNVCTAFDLLKGREINGNKAIVVGGGGVGCDVALFLRNKGKDVTIVEMLDKIGNDIGRTTRWIVKNKLKEKNVETITKARVTAIENDGVVAECEGKTINVKGDMVVLAVGTASNKELYNALSEMKDKFGDIYLIGDALKPRKALDAIREGAEIAYKL
ncbi:MAG: NADH oxidase [Candidatus Methanoliparum thermophilum]|uniref:NADH oxidase n=1 Tax=Methanoliparum thermophilum TaxID=2491083 RepID=A0A520KTY1_METT2|nr:FAD-dependent oxidoreductase [Candidatus Methanoliparum sp. LAM-1]RZN65539.1 MAG: NADH oxidase [Candidatus Methanoliparum thermophilum]BDC35364.1 NADH oxidase [Candidatus Methanoliparum sp. LAM-1]